MAHFEFVELRHRCVCSSAARAGLASNTRIDKVAALCVSGGEPFFLDPVVDESDGIAAAEIERAMSAAIAAENFA
jgi:hypothetical protein